MFERNEDALIPHRGLQIEDIGLLTDTGHVDRF